MVQEKHRDELRTYGTDFGMSSQLLTAEQLAKELNLPSENFVKVLTRKRKIPVIKVGHRTHRYSLEGCRAALAKLEVRAV